MDLIIRPVKLEDAVSINEMRRMDGVRENTLGLFSEFGEYWSPKILGEVNDSYMNQGESLRYYTESVGHSIL